MKKTDNKTRRLSLRRDVIRKLDRGQLAQVAGGAGGSGGFGRTHDIYQCVVSD